MPLAVVCDEHTPYGIRDGLVSRGIDAVSVQQIGLRSAPDEVILAVALEHGRVVYTSDTDYLRHHAAGVPHAGIFFHNVLKYSIGEALDMVEMACKSMDMGEMRGHLEYL